MNSKTPRNVQHLKFILAVILISALAGCATAPRGTIVEWAEFKTAAGVSDVQVLEASDAVQKEFLNAQKGFIRRELLKGKDGQWSDLIYWQSKAAADEAAKKVEHSSACAGYFKCMANPDAGVLHFTRVRSYP